jgi:hypothetical protein
VVFATLNINIYPSLGVAIALCASTTLYVHIIFSGCSCNRRECRSFGVVTVVSCGVVVYMHR